MKKNLPVKNDCVKKNPLIQNTIGGPFLIHVCKNFNLQKKIKSIQQTINLRIYIFTESLNHLNNFLMVLMMDKISMPMHSELFQQTLH